MPETCEARIARGGWTEDRERNRCTAPIGPINTYSNAGYFLAAAILLYLRPERAAVSLAVSLVVLGLGSSLYHALKYIWANKLDWVGMLMTFGALATHGIIPESSSAPWLMLVVGGILGYYWPRAFWTVGGDQLMLLLGFVAGLRPIVVGSHQGLAYWALGCFAVAYGCWQLDKHHVKIIGRYGHGAWHLLSSLGILLLYLAQ